MRIGLQIQENLTPAFLFLSFMFHFSSILVSAKPVFVKIAENQLNGTRNSNTTDSTLSRTSKSEAMLPSTPKSETMLPSTPKPDTTPRTTRPDETSAEYIPKYIKDTGLQMAQVKVVKKSPEAASNLGDIQQSGKDQALARSKHTSERDSFTKHQEYKSNINRSAVSLPEPMLNNSASDTNFQFSQNDVYVCSREESTVVHKWTSGCCQEERGIPCLCDPTGCLSAIEVSKITDEVGRLKAGTACLCKGQQQQHFGETCQDSRGFDILIFFLPEYTYISSNTSNITSLGNCLRHEKRNLTECESIIVIYSTTAHKIYTSVGVSASSQGLTEICLGNIHKKYHTTLDDGTRALTLTKIIAEYRKVLETGKCDFEKSQDEKDKPGEGLSLYGIIVIALLSTLVVIAAVGYICSERCKIKKKHRRPSTSQFSPRGSGQAHLYGRQWYTEVTFRRDGPCSYMGIFPRGRGMMYN